MVTPDDKLLAEVAEDQGDHLALSRDFDVALRRSARRSRKRVVTRLQELASDLLSWPKPGPLMAAAAALVLVLVGTNAVYFDLIRNPSGQVDGPGSGTSQPLSLGSPRGIANSSDRYVAHVVLDEDEARARSSLRDLERQFADVLRDRNITIRRVDRDSKVSYNAVVGPFESIGDASEFCNHVAAVRMVCRIERD